MTLLQTDTFGLDDYLQRIEYAGEVSTDLNCLRAIIRAHGQTIPFENLDVMAHGTINLEPAHLVEKIVYGGRGGYCYENNAVLYMALTAAGFQVQLVAARPRIFPVLRPRTHMAVVVTLEDKQWLCDPAFGGQMPPEPLCLQRLDEVITMGSDQFKMTLDEAVGEYYVHALMPAESADDAGTERWQTQYSFALTPQEWVDFAPGNFLNSTHPDSFFRKQPAMVLFTPEGRNSLFGNRLKVMRDGVTETRVLADDEFDGVFRDYFRITGRYEFNVSQIS